VATTALETQHTIVAQWYSAHFLTPREALRNVAKNIPVVLFKFTAQTYFQGTYYSQQIRNTFKVTDPEAPMMT
jgi:hypothetical protein